MGFQRHSPSIRNGFVSLAVFYLNLPAAGIVTSRIHSFVGDVSYNFVYI